MNYIVDDSDFNINNDNDDFFDNVIKNICDSTTNVNMCKPTAANIVLENHHQASQLQFNITSPIDNHPINIIDQDQHILQPTYPAINSLEEKEIDLVGEVLDSTIDTNHLADDDPIMRALQSAQDITNQHWTPSLNTIIEENEYDMKIASGMDPIHHTTHVSNKRQRGRSWRNQKLQSQYEAKITSAIKNNGIYRTTIDTAQSDSGANRSVTNQKHLLINFKEIPPYAIKGVNDEEAAIHCTGIGYLPWKADTGEILLIQCLYCKESAGTIISPSSVNLQYQDKYDGWVMETNFDSKHGQLTFNARDGVNHLVFSAYSDNNLWYHYLDEIPQNEFQSLNTQSKAVVNSLNSTALYHLWHHRLGHPCDKILQEAHKNCEGIPKLHSPSFFNCSVCNSSKFRKRHIGQTKRINKPISNNEGEQIEVGQHLHVDFGFVRGSDYSKTDKDGRLITSKDGYRSYCLVIDRASRYITVILTKTKEPPIRELRHIFQQFRSKVKATHCTVTTDLGGELAGSKAFTKLLMEKDVGYIPKTTAAHSSAQNGMAEKPNQDLARMIRSLLFGAGLGSEYWAYAMRHAVYLKNRLPHSSLHYITPYEKVNKVKPNLGNLRVFGSRVHFLHKNRQKKLDKIDNVGKFMTYKGNDTLAYVIDDVTGRERVATHLNFDEAYASVPAGKQPPMGVALQQSGYVPEKENICRVKVKLLHKAAKLPVKGSVKAAGFDIHSVKNTTITPNSQSIIPTGIALEIPVGYHAELKIRSSFATKYMARVEAGIIDSDYRGQVYIVISNNGTEDIPIDQGDRIAQMILIKDPTVQMNMAPDLNRTKRNEGKFGSTGISHIIPSELYSESNAAAATLSTTHSAIDSHHQIELSTDPFNDTQLITFNTRGKHPTQGMQLLNSDNWNDRVIIKTCKPGTATSKIPNWTKRLKNSVLLEVNGTKVTSVNQVTSLLQQKPRNTPITIKVGLQEKLAMHEDTGTPMLYFDQLHAISTHLQQISLNRQNETLDSKPIPQSTPYSKLAKAIKSLNVTATIAVLHGILPKNKVKTKRLTRKKLQSSAKWSTWKAAEWKQLQQYWGQKMFGHPCPLPPNANVLNLLWDYRIKDDGTYKARMVCNGRPSNKNTVIFGYTYAKSLDHVGSRVFWAVAAAKNYIVLGADASNAFAEADPPRHPLYVRVNQPYREWWSESMKQPDIPNGWVLPVHKALQGHPEAPRAWATKIDNVLQKKLKFVPTTHEPCLYCGKHNGHEVMILRQVDDFAIAAKDEAIAQDVIKCIDKYMTIEIKDLGKLTRYNGVDIVQTRNYIKLNNPTYLKKIIQEHRWMIEDVNMPTFPLPMTEEKEYLRQLETADAPTSEEDKTSLQMEMKFNYRQAIGELIFAMVTCRPDISFPLIKLSQYSANPARIHYEAVINIFRYLNSSINDGIIYWRTEPMMSLPEGPTPTTYKDNYKIDPNINSTGPTNLQGMVDSDWAGDTAHRKSVSGIILTIAGGCILYKTKYQDTLALSTTEAEFTAACDAGKCILYVRSILDEINVPQDNATTLYIDNNGALLMGNAQKPTRRTRHMDLKKFALLDWIKKDLLIMKRIKTSDNSSDAMTKQTGRQLFHRHFDLIMGRIKPDYVEAKQSQSQTQISTQTKINTKLVKGNSPKTFKLGVLTNKEGISYIGE